MRTELNFTKKSVEGLPYEKGDRRKEYYDTQVRGLAIRVSKASKRFVFVKNHHGRIKRVSIGAFPEASIHFARKKALEIHQQFNSGVDPLSDKRQARQELTFGELFHRFYENYSKIHKKSHKQDWNMYHAYLKQSWGAKRLTSITREDVAQLHTRLGMENGEFTANRVHELIRTMYNRATDWELTDNNPATRIKRFKERSRERFLSEGELKRFVQALEKEPSKDARDLFTVMLFTGARKTETLAMEWAHIDLFRKDWSIPDGKNGDIQRINLTPPAIDVLESREQNSKFVFQSESATGHMVDPKKAWKRILERAGIKELRMHDLRRTFGSYQALAGSSLQLIGKSLNHKSLEATVVYARLVDDAVVASANAGVQKMQEVLNG